MTPPASFPPPAGVFPRTGAELPTGIGAAGTGGRAVRRLLLTLLLIAAGACGATDASASLRPLAGYPNASREGAYVPGEAVVKFASRPSLTELQIAAVGVDAGRPARTQPRNSPAPTQASNPHSGSRSYQAHPDSSVTTL